MIPEIIKKWNENKYKLEEYFRNTEQIYYNNYLDILEKIIELVLENEYDANKITMIDDGDYQGTQIFLIPRKTYQPTIEDYLITHTYYGSCIGCDTLQAIHRYKEEYPTEQQIKDYMQLALHLLQKMKKLEDE